LIKPSKIKNAFLICSILLVAVLSVPRLGGTENIWINGLYVAVCIIIIFLLLFILVQVAQYQEIFHQTMQISG
jgi:hypothetical protein